jgi:hypothetical protein
MDDPLGEGVPLRSSTSLFHPGKQYLGDAHHILPRTGLIMGTGPSKIPSDSPLGCLLANLKPLQLLPDLKAKKLIFLSNQAWPQYPLDNASKWPFNGTFNPNILRDLYNFCEHAGKWKELSYIQSFSYLYTKLSLCTSCSPAQVLSASKPAYK